jgi:SAM-dependent methyltransferase
VFARAERLPFRSGSFDTVLGLSMLNNLPQPERLLDEAHRVLRPGGILLLEFPQMMALYGEPHDYFRFTRHGATWLLERARFEPLAIIGIGGLSTRVGLAAIDALNRLNRGPWRVITELPVRILYVVLQLLFAGLERLLFDPREVVANLVVARRREPPVA